MLIYLLDVCFDLCEQDTSHNHKTYHSYKTPSNRIIRLRCSLCSTPKVRPISQVSLLNELLVFAWHGLGCGRAHGLLPIPSGLGLNVHVLTD